MPQQERNLVEVAAGQVAQPRACAAQIARPGFSMPALAAAVFTTSQSTLGVMPRFVAGVTWVDGESWHATWKVTRAS